MGQEYAVKLAEGAGKTTSQDPPRPPAPDSHAAPGKNKDDGRREPADSRVME